MDQVTPDRTMSGRASLVPASSEQVALRPTMSGRAPLARARSRAWGRWCAGVVAATVVVLGLGASTAVAGAVAGHTFEIRPVVATDVSADQCAGRVPASCLVAESRDGSVRSRLGPVILDGSDVKSAGVRFQSGTGWTVLIGLTPSGQRAFNAAAAAQYGQTPPADQVALVVDGVVEASPSVQSPNFEGDIAISGDFTKAEAKAAARAIRRSS